MYCLYTGKRKISVENILTIFMKLYNFVPFGRPHSGTVIIQLMAELDVSNNLMPEQQYQNRLESKAMHYFFG